MISKEIQSIRDQYKKETTLNHSKQGLGHTQYYSEWSEYKMVEQQQQIQRLQSTPTNNEIEDAKESLRLYQDSNCELSDEKIDGIIGLIERLKGEQVIRVTKEASKVLWRSGKRKGLNGTIMEKNVLVMYDCIPVEIIAELPKAPEVG